MTEKQNDKVSAKKYGIIANVCAAISIVLFLAVSYDLFGIVYPLYIVISCILLCIILLAISWYGWVQEDKIKKYFENQTTKQN